MQSQAKTVAEYLAELPADRRAAIEAVRALIRKSVPKGIEEGMQYGMIGYYVPHSLYPAGYHCDPKQPLPFAALASQKNAMSLYVFCLYTEPEASARFVEAWKATGKKLDMGKSCVRFKRVEDLALDVLGQALGRVSVKDFIAGYEAARDASGTASAKAAKRATAKPAAEKAAPTKSAAAKAPTVKKPTAKKPAPKKPAPKKPAPKKPAPKKLAETKPAAKKAAAKPSKAKKAASK